MREATTIARTRRVLAPALLLAAAGCSYLPDMPSLPAIGGFKPYRIDIQQGNYLSPEMVAQLKPGMTREQVRFVLGTPLVADVFHAERWDYVFYRELGNGGKEQRHLSVFFKDDKLSHFTGDVPPVEAKPAAVAEPKPVDPKPVAEQSATGKPQAKD